jgi:hypothetical protein
MKIKNYCYVFIITLFTITACKKTDTSTPAGTNGPTGTTGATGTTGSTGSTGVTGSTGTTSNGPDVYVSGYIKAVNGYNVAVYWKNGVIKKLTDSTSNCQAYGITVSNGDVYVVGILQTIPNSNDPSSSTYNVAYWKNGIMTKWGNGYAYQIAVQGTDVYLAGSTPVPNTIYAVATYWKNGVPTTLHYPNEKSSEANGIDVNGSDVYITSNVTTQAPNANNFIPYAVCWKNNQVSTLTDGLLYSIANGVAVNNNDVYVFGSSRPNNTVERATYWKNGVINVIGPIVANHSSSSTSIAFSGNDIYLGGYDSGNNIGTFGAYWKNTTQTTSTLYGGYGKIAINGNDLYIITNYINTNGSSPAYILNGTMVRLSGNILGQAYGIAVVPK